MTPETLFTAGTSGEAAPKGDAARQAIHALRGYEYQVLAATLALVDLEEDGRLYLEVAEDYATITEQALRVTQVKDTKGSGRVTLNHKDIKGAVHRFVQLVEQNPGRVVHLRYFTTSEIGREKCIGADFGGLPGLVYWRRAAAQAARTDLSPLREVLESPRFHEEVRQFCRSSNEESLRRNLLARIHWDCGQPDVGILRQELEARLIEKGKDLSSLSAPEARKLVATLAFAVLEKSTHPDVNRRLVTRADLYSAIDSVATSSVPTKLLIETLAQRVPGVPTLVSEGLEGHEAPAIAETNWLIEGSTLPALDKTIARSAVESTVAAALRDFGAGVLVGSSGLGKSILARTVVSRHSEEFHIVDFQGIGVSETRSRTEMVFSCLGGLRPPALILDNLNPVDPQVVLSLARVLEAGRRHQCEVVITCYQQPSPHVLGQLGLEEEGSVIVCPPFSQEDTIALVRLYGGDVQKWGRLAYLAGAGGHPQLTHAFVRGLASRGWPREAVDEVLNRGLSSPDIEVTRDEARRRAASLLSREARDLLYRLSITIGTFDRALALRIGAISPAVDRTGECIDQLVGAWIERSGEERLRVSPLASRFGPEMLGDAERQAIHKTIAVEMVRRGRGGADDLNVILAHAMAGKAEESLRAVAAAVLTAGSGTLEKLADLFYLRYAQTESPLYTDDESLSVLLRITQLKLVGAVGDADWIPRVVAALSEEIKSVSDEKSRSALEASGMATVFSTVGVGNYLDNWIRTLVEYVTSEGREEFAGVMGEMGNAVGGAPESLLFYIGSIDLTPVARLEHVMEELHEVDPQVRELLLTPMDPVFGDYALLVNRAWQIQEGRDDFDAEDAAVRYGRMARRTRAWGIRSLSLQCTRAQAVMLDEYLGDREGAIEVLLEAVSVLGDDQIISRTLGGIYHRHGQHDEAFQVFKGVADEVGGDSPIERAIALREAAISAGNCQEWEECAEWFGGAQGAAEKVDTDDMRVMAVGLMADSAVAALEGGDREGAILHLAGALDAVKRIEPDLSLAAAYCHRVVRHTVLWVKNRIEGSDLSVDGEATYMEVGACSNLMPAAGIEDLPLAELDYAWYLLAQAETILGANLGITATLGDRIEGEPVTMGEIFLRMEKTRSCIERLDAGGFADGFLEYLEARVYLAEKGAELRGIGEGCPTRGEVPAIDEGGCFSPSVNEFARKGILAYWIQSVSGGGTGAMEELRVALEARFSGTALGETVRASISDESTAESGEVSPLDKEVMSRIRQLSRVDHLPPGDFWTVGLRLFEWTWHSEFKSTLVRSLARWVRAGWERVLREESFRLLSPHASVPVVEEVLDAGANDEAFLAKILLASSEAVGAGLDESYRGKLHAIARGE